MDVGKQRLGVLAGVVMFFAATTAVALSCVDANSERVTYEVAEVRIDGEVVDAAEFGDRAIAHGDYEGGLWLELSNGDWTSQLSFGGGAQ